MMATIKLDDIYLCNIALNYDVIDRLRWYSYHFDWVVYGV